MSNLQELVEIVRASRDRTNGYRGWTRSIGAA